MSTAVQTVQAVYDAFASGDVPTVLAALGSDVEWITAEHLAYCTGGPFVGHQAVLKGVFAGVAQAFDDFRVEVKRLVGCGDTVLVEARYHAVSKATGRVLDAQVAHVWDVRDGKVVKMQQYADTWHIARVTGGTPE